MRGAQVQVHALTSDQVGALATEQLASLGTAQIAALDVEDVAAFGTSGIVALTTAQLVALTTEQYASLSTDQFQALSSGDIAALTTMQAHALTTDQVHAMTTDQVAGLETADILALTTDTMLAFSTDALQAMDGAQLDALLLASPIVLDLDGNGIQTVAAAQGVSFDLNATGHASQVGWVGAGDGLLVRDRNGNGSIDNGSELYGVATQTATGRAGNGYAAMASEDSNHDGKLNAKDAHFSELEVWVDANHDGKSAADELRGLIDMGIAEIDLNYTKTSTVQNGNVVGMVSSYTTTDGQQHQVADVWFGKQASGTPPSASELLAAAPSELLSDPAGTGAPAAHAAPATTSAHAALLRTALEEELNRQTPLI